MVVGTASVLGTQAGGPPAPSPCLLGPHVSLRPPPENQDGGTGPNGGGGAEQRHTGLGGVPLRPTASPGQEPRKFLQIRPEGQETRRSELPCTTGRGPACGAQELAVLPARGLSAGGKRYWLH